MGLETGEWLVGVRNRGNCITFIYLEIGGAESAARASLLIP